MQAQPETTLMTKALLGLRLDIGRLLPFLQAFSDKGYPSITLGTLTDITIRKVGITQDSIGRVRTIADRYPEMKKSEFARYLKISRQTIYNWIEEGLFILTPDRTRVRTDETALFWEILLHLIGQS